MFYSRGGGQGGLSSNKLVLSSLHYLVHQQIIIGVLLCGRVLTYLGAFLRLEYLISLVMGDFLQILQTLPNTTNSRILTPPWSEAHLIYSETFFVSWTAQMNKFIANYSGTFTSGGNDECIYFVLTSRGNWTHNLICHVVRLVIYPCHQATQMLSVYTIATCSIMIIMVIIETW